MMAYNQLTLEQAEAKLLGSFSSLVWIIPFIVLIDIWMNYYYQTSIGVTSNLISILKSLIWVMFLLKLVNIADNQIDKQRKYSEMKLKIQQTQQSKG